jgi:hypothetical protein
MVPTTFDDVLQALNFTSTLFSDKHVLLARHASEAHEFLLRSIEVFEEYQRFQSADHFRFCTYIVSFVGLKNNGGAATFAGIYKVVARLKIGDEEFREPSGDPDVVAACAGQEYLYGLVRLQEYDFLQCQWDVIWNLPGPAKYQYLRPNLPIESTRMFGVPPFNIEAAISTHLTEGATADQISDEAVYFSEGSQYYSRHVRRERSAALVTAVKEKARSAGQYFCWVCKADFQKIYGLDYIECHHTIPVSTLGPGPLSQGGGSRMPWSLQMHYDA